LSINPRFCFGPVTWQWTQCMSFEKSHTCTDSKYICWFFCFGIFMLFGWKRHALQDLTKWRNSLSRPQIEFEIYASSCVNRAHPGQNSRPICLAYFKPTGHQFLMPHVFLHVCGRVSVSLPARSARCFCLSNHRRVRSVQPCMQEGEGEEKAYCSRGSLMLKIGS
jgi:hypothetical protein